MSSSAERPAATEHRFYFFRHRKNAVGKVYAVSWHSYKTREKRDIWAGRYRRMGDEVIYDD